MKKYPLGFFIFLFLFLPVISLSPVAHAQPAIFPGETASNCPPSNPNGIGIPNPLKGGCSLYELIRLIIADVFIPVGGVIVVFFLIYSGFLFVVSAGNEEKLKTAKHTFLYTIIGAAVLLGSWVIAEGIKNTIDQIKQTSVPLSHELVLKEIDSKIPSHV